MNRLYDDQAIYGNYGMGRLTKVTDLSGSTAFQHDRLGNNVNKIRTVTGVAGTFATSSEYDAPGATISGATWANGRLDQALSFYGNDTASIQNYDSPTKAISLEFWLRRLVSGTIIEKSGCYSITCDAQGTISGSLTMKNASVVTLSAAGADYNVWKHIVLTYDGATMKFYVNGSSVAAVVASGDIATNTNPIVLGSNFTGRIDELKISGNALSASEIAARYDAVPNIVPNQPLMPRVNSTGNVYTTYFTTASCWDTDGSQLKYIFDWGDSTEYTTTTFITNGSVVCSSHSWSALGEYFVRIRAMDERGGTSAWSPCYPLNIVSSHPNGVRLSSNILIGASASLLECSSAKLSMIIAQPAAGTVTSAQAQCRFGYPDTASACQSMLWDVVQTPFATGGTEAPAPNKMVASQIAALQANTTTQIAAIQSAITQNAGNTIKDAHGNTLLANNRWIKYDYDNRPIKIVMQDGTQTEFTYDYQGQRVIKRHLDAQRAELTKTLYIGTIYEKNLTSSETIKQIHAATQRIATISSTDGLSYIHADHLGSTNKLTSGNQNTLGQVIRTTTYTPYGTTYASNGSIDTTRKYTGQISDDTTGLYYYNARYYDPQLGVFITPDTIVQNPYDPQSLNRYAYCRNNPVIYTDPSGHIFGIDDLIIIGAAALIGGVKEGTHNFSRDIWGGNFDWGAAGKGAFDWGITAAAICGLSALTGFDTWVMKTFDVELFAYVGDPAGKIASISSNGSWQVLGWTGVLGGAGAVIDNLSESPKDSNNNDSTTVNVCGANSYDNPYTSEFGMVDAGSGKYIGTGYGEEAAEWYADKYNQTENPMYKIGGWAASLWTPDTYKKTSLTFTGAYAARVAGPFSTRGLPPYISRIREYLRLDPPHHGQRWHIDGKIGKW